VGGVVVVMSPAVKRDWRFKPCLLVTAAAFKHLTSQHACESACAAALQLLHNLTHKTCYLG
jgi:hypothetical protein